MSRDKDAKFTAKNENFRRQINRRCILFHSKGTNVLISWSEHNRTVVTAKEVARRHVGSFCLSSAMIYFCILTATLSVRETCQLLLRTSFHCSFHSNSAVIVPLRL